MSGSPAYTKPKPISRLHVPAAAVRTIISPEEMKKDNPTIFCGCGCNGQMLEYDDHDRRRSFLQGHWSRANKHISAAHLIKIAKERTGKHGYYWTPDPSHTTTHRRARHCAKQETCVINNIHCKGRLNVAHLDGNALNNELNNLATLCNSHHRLLDNNKLKLNQLTKIDYRYYVDRGGKRRYWK